MDQYTAAMSGDRLSAGPVAPNSGAPASAPHARVQAPNPISSAPVAPSSSAPSDSRADPRAVDAVAARLQRDRLARAGQAPWLHEDVAQRMLERLPLIRRQPGRIVLSSALLGGGHEGLRALYPQARQQWWEHRPLALERAGALHRRSGLGALWGSLRGAPTVQVLPAPPPGEAELLWSNMELHAEADKAALLSRWQQALAVDGFLMFSCLGPDSLVELRPLFEQAGWGDPAPQWTDMHDLGDLLVQAGFADPVMDQEHVRLTWGRAEDLLRDLRALGGNLAPGRHAGLRTPRWHGRLLAALETLRGADGRLAMTLELVYGHAFKAQPRLKVQPETSVSLDQMRAMVRRPSDKT